MLMKKKSLFAGFSLVELMVVITIIAILAALVLRIYGLVNTKASRARVEGELNAMSSALERYKTDNGEYPPGTNLNTSGSGSSNYFLYDALYPTSTGSKVYYEFPKTMTNSSTNIIDAWGNAYGYQCPGDPSRNGTNSFDLWSTANQPNNTNAWIKNW